LPRHGPLDGIAGVMLDLDGVLWVGRTPVRGAPEAVEKMREMGKRIVFTTNNSSRSRRECVAMLGKIGIRAAEMEILTSGYVAAVYLSRVPGRVRAYVIGERGLKEELSRAGIRLLSEDRADEATHLVVGKDSGINYGRIWAGLRAIMSGAEFVATNTDPTYPTERGLAPGAGSMVGAITGCSGRSPDVIMGKPYPHMMKLALELMGTEPERTAIIGDRLEIDVRAGKSLGMRTVLVLSGVTGREAVKKIGKEMRPDFVFGSLAEAVR